MAAMAEKLRTAVVGVGYLGKFHAQKYATLPQSQLVAVCDTKFDQLSLVAQTLNIPGHLDYHNLIGLVDAVSIATPTPTHYAIASFFLAHGIHVLLEKPIAITLKEADELIRLAKLHHTTLQIGHIERFNNVIKAAEPLILNPRFIESLRLAPFKTRGSEVSVILDLMIHDIDIIQSIVKSNVQKISANGAAVLSPFLDIANARLEFTNGCVANVTASRVNSKVSRRMHIFQYDKQISLDLQNKKLSVTRKGNQEILPGIPEVIREKQSFSKDDPLNDQIESFLNCILTQTPPLVNGEEGKKALATAIQIAQIIHETQPSLIYAE